MNTKKKLKIRVDAHNQPPKVVGSARNEFGTRLCQRVECTRCQKTDYVPVRVSNSKRGYCRACAELLLQTFEQGRYIAPKTVARTCTQCARSFAVSEKINDKKDDLLCLDCYRGFDVWRGKAASAQGSQEFLWNSGAIGSKTIIRKVHK